MYELRQTIWYSFRKTLNNRNCVYLRNSDWEGSLRSVIYHENQICFHDIFLLKNIGQYEKKLIQHNPPPTLFDNRLN